MNRVEDAPLCHHSAAGTAAAPQRVAQLLAALGLVALLVADALLLGNALQVLRAARAAIAYPFELDFAEGLVLAPTRALAAGLPVYPPVTDAPARISNYTPLYYAAAAGLGAVLGDDLAAGRALSLASALLAAAVLAALAWRAIAPAAGPRLRALAAACAGLAFVQISYTASWAALMRVDLLAVLLAFVGVLVFGATAARGARVYWCLLPLVAAAYTKQTTVAAAAACVLTAARGSLRRGLALGGTFAAALLLLGAALQVATRGSFAFHVVTANLHPFSWDQALSFLQGIAIRYPVFVALAVAVVPGLVASLPRPHDQHHGQPAAARLWTRATLGAYLPLAALASLTVGKRGAEANYLIELMGVVCAAAAVAIGEALAVDPRAPQPRGSAIAAAAVPALLLWQLLELAPPSTIEVVEVPPPAHQARVAELVDVLRRSDGPVLSEDLTLLSLAGQPIRFQPFDSAHLVQRHRLDEASLVGALERGAVPLVVLHFDVGHPPPLAYDRFTPAMLDAIRRRYRTRATYPGYWLYVPAAPGRSDES